jgi:hypothetical protein
VAFLVPMSVEMVAVDGSWSILLHTAERRCVVIVMKEVIDVELKSWGSTREMFDGGCALQGAEYLTLRLYNYLLHRAMIQREKVIYFAKYVSTVFPV